MNMYSQGGRKASLDSVLNHILVNISTKLSATIPLYTYDIAKYSKRTIFLHSQFRHLTILKFIIIIIQVYYMIISVVVFVVLMQ